MSCSRVESCVSDTTSTEDNQSTNVATSDESDAAGWKPAWCVHAARAVFELSIFPCLCILTRRFHNVYDWGEERGSKEQQKERG